MIAVSWTVPIGLKAAQTVLDIQSILERGTQQTILLSEWGDVQDSLKQPIDAGGGQTNCYILVGVQHVEAPSDTGGYVTINQDISWR
jgi:hypothetical protein